MTAQRVTILGVGVKAINLGQTPATIEQWLARRGMTSAMAKQPARAVA
jgi:hypothetical protein